MTLMVSPTVCRCIQHHPEPIKFGHVSYPRLLRDEIYILPEELAKQLQNEKFILILNPDNENASSIN